MNTGWRGRGIVPGYLDRGSVAMAAGCREQGHLMTPADQFLRQSMNNPLNAPVPHRRCLLVDGGDHRDTQHQRPCQVGKLNPERGLRADRHRRALVTAGASRPVIMRACPPVDVCPVDVCNETGGTANGNGQSVVPVRITTKAMQPVRPAIYGGFPRQSKSTPRYVNSHNRGLRRKSIYACPKVLLSLTKCEILRT